MKIGTVSSMYVLLTRVLRSRQLRLVSCISAIKDHLIAKIVFLCALLGNNNNLLSVESKTDSVCLLVSKNKSYTLRCGNCCNI